MNICDAQVSDAIRQWLRMPTFDARPWEDEELLLLLQQMYLDHDLCSKFAIDIQTLRNFLYEAYKNYNDVPFHNFRHCFCVAQMMYAISWCVDLPSKIGDLEVLILLTSCICHDLDHPGYNNIYQINAKTELAIRYNDISPLENHHCSVAFRILENEDCNIFKSFSSEDFKLVREGMIRSILATDMARHNEILTNFKEILPNFNYNDKAHVNLLCMVLIKVSDISNEARPMEVAEPWLDKLLQEFFKQSDAEKLEGLPVTPFMDREKITKPSSQCSFIGFVLLPLFEALGELFEELQDLIVQPVREALDYYRRLNEANKEERMHRKSIVELEQHSATHSPDSGKGGAHSKNMRKSLSFQTRSRSRSTDDDPDVQDDHLSAPSATAAVSAGSSTSELNAMSNLEKVQEDPESGDSETATEVEVSEKALKFKISTESSICSATTPLSMTGRKSYPGSRKGSRERVQHLNHSDVAKMVQKGKLRCGALSFDQHCMVGNKKLSFDPPAFLDEYALTLKKKFEEGLAAADQSDSEEEYYLRKDGECVLSKETLNLNKRNSEHSVKAHLDLEKKSILKPERKMNNNRSDYTSYQDSPQKTQQQDLLSKEERLVCPNNTRQNSVKNNCEPQSPQEPFNEQVTETKANRSFLSRLRQLTDRWGLSAAERQQCKATTTASARNNNYSKGSTPSKVSKNKHKKLDSSGGGCCKGGLHDGSKASTLPKTKRSGGGGKKSWKFLGRGGKGWASDAAVDEMETVAVAMVEGEGDDQSVPSTSRVQSNCASPNFSNVKGGCTPQTSPHKKGSQVQQEPQLLNSVSNNVVDKCIAKLQEMKADELTVAVVKEREPPPLI
ncbi:unnamed protein product [Callosobruchus maculatus]|uniref:Phosphodiesterase n=1 Tax=Callosobruchus maculatus TaxID=64391 RepID=A0A653C3F0_CALMS|nr:unnamed protein product [Callosobruchus maculatus]